MPGQVNLLIFELQELRVLLEALVAREPLDDCCEGPSSGRCYFCSARLREDLEMVGDDPLFPAWRTLPIEPHTAECAWDAARRALERKP